MYGCSCLILGLDFVEIIFYDLRINPYLKQKYQIFPKCLCLYLKTQAVSSNLRA